MNIAFIGIGVMGISMARNLMKNGHSLAVYTRTASKAEPLSEESVYDLASVTKLFTCVSLMRRSNWMATWPRPPAPMTTVEEPARRRCRLRLMTEYGVRPASFSGAIFTGSRSPSGTRARFGTAMYSAMPPLAPRPGPGVVPRGCDSQ